MDKLWFSHNYGSVQLDLFYSQWYFWTLKEVCQVYIHIVVSINHYPVFLAV
jgi:hypothetical protein